MLTLDSITVEEGAPVPKRHSSRTAEANPFTDIVAKSRAEGNKGMAFRNIPNNQVRAVVSALRRAADTAGLGLRCPLYTEYDGHDFDLANLEQYITDGAILELDIASKTVRETGEATGLDIVYKAEPTSNYTGPVLIVWHTKDRKKKKDENTTVDNATDEATEPTTDTATEEPAEDTAQPTRRRGRR